MGQFDELDELATEIARKATAAPDKSYTAQLIAKGLETCAKKFGEEAIELAMAAAMERPDKVAHEAADVLYHLLVLLKAAGVKTSDVMDVLKHRKGVSGLDEKAARKT
jgi:phosphoribosyl-ATP pyrophosphohydrolase